MFLFNTKTALLLLTLPSFVCIPIPVYAAEELNYTPTRYKNHTCLKCACIVLPVGEKHMIQVFLALGFVDSKPINVFKK